MAHYLLLLLTLILFPFIVFSQTTTANIAVGSSITASESSNPWLSPSGDFAFGFQQLQNNTNLFVLAIWFARIPNRTIVWFERRSYPVPRGSVLRLDGADGLVLRDPQGRHLYNTDGLADRVASGFMNDTGNFVLLRSDSTYLWQSFSSPADTILPTQSIEINSQLISRKTPTNFSEGRFYAGVNGAGDFVLSTKRLDTNVDFDADYYNSQSSDRNSSNPGYQLVFNERGSIAVMMRDGEQQNLTSSSFPSVSDNYYRATIDFDGVFTQYYFPRNFNSSSRWTAANSWPDNICTGITGGTGSGACGYNSVCSLENSRPVCRCPQGFSLADPNDAYGNCNPNFSQSNCVQGVTDKYDLLNISNIDWPLSDYEQITPSTADGCRNACMNDCFCAAAIYRSQRCWKKKLPLTNGRVDTSLGATAFLKFRVTSTTANIAVGSSITASESSNPWLSPSGDFAFGFQQLQNNTNLFVLAIWFATIPDRTIVWFERSSYPVPRGSILRLDAAAGLVLQDPQGRHLYSTNDLADQVASGFMNDTGNFVLLRSNSTNLWQSFGSPADTILPTQSIEINSQLISRKTPTNFSEGRFYARVNGAGDFVLSTKRLDTYGDFEAEYYNSQTSDRNSSNPGYQLAFNERGSIAVMMRDGEQQNLTSSSFPPVSDNYYRATIDFDGVFTQYYFPRNFNSSSRWRAANSWPDNICLGITGATGSGACGYNSVCNLENSRPVCRCPQGFSLADPNDEYGNCNPNFSQSNCVQGETDEYELLEIFDTDWPRSDYEQIITSTADGCRNACMNDCFCAVAVYSSQSCRKKKLPLSNGRVDTSWGATAFLKFRKGDAHRPKNDRKGLVIVGSVLLGSSAFVNILLISAACIGFFLIYNKRLSVINLARETNSVTNFRCFSFKELVQATDGFKEEVGRGAFGIVYKGVVTIGGEHVVAVKKLNKGAQDSEKEFRTEVNVIGQIHHKNLVPLIGFCDEGDHQLLVYEYMSNETLAGFLFGDKKPSWGQRTQIALGVARGLTYLHEECSTQIIHCDIKPQNILLDEYLNARISDFGLAKLLMMDQSNTLTNIRGTKGYVAPEWFRNMKITAKVDVYSFGVLLLEIVCCRKSVESMEFDGENPILTDWVWDCFVERRLDALVENDAEAMSDRQTFEKYVRVGIWCIQEDASLRPTMRKAFQMLEGSVEVGMPPCPYPINSTV